MKMTYEADSDPIRVKLEIDESAGELDVARENFETALQEMLCTDEVSESDGEEPPQDTDHTSSHNNNSDLNQQQQQPTNENNSNNSTTSSARPPRKRRRKDADQSQHGVTVAGQQSSFVVRMFDRSVDLAHFSHNSPLYPICRAWLLNEPHQANMGDAVLAPCSPGGSSSTSTGEGSLLQDVHHLPSPTPRPVDATNTTNPLIPEPISPPPYVNQNPSGPPSPTALLEHHVRHWRSVRQSWKNAASLEDARYERSATLLKDLFRAQAAASADGLPL